MVDFTKLDYRATSKNSKTGTGFHNKKGLY